MRKYFLMAVLFLMSAESLFAADIKIGSCVYTFNDAYMTRYRNAMAAEAEKNGVNLTVLNSQNSQGTQNEQVDEFIANGVDALIINPVDRTDIAEIIEKAKAANIPVVFVNREPPEALLGSYEKTYYVGSNAEQSGKLSGGIIVDYFKNHPEADKNHDGKIQFVMLKGENGHQDMIARSKFSVETIENSGAFKPVELASALANWDKFQAMTIMNAFIMSIGTDDIEAVIANNDEMALGAVEALKANDFNKGDKEFFIPVVGVDGNAGAIDAMNRNEIIGTVFQNAEAQGSAAVKIAISAAKNLPVDKNNTGFAVENQKYIWIPYEKVTPEILKEGE